MKKLNILIIFILSTLCVTSVSAEWTEWENGDSYGDDQTGDIWVNISNAYDGDWDTYAEHQYALGGGSYYYVNYSMPNETTFVIWSVKDGEGYKNISLPESGCLETARLSGILELSVWGYENNYLDYNCYGIVVYNFENSVYLFEEKLLITNDSCVETIDCGFCEYCDAGTCANQTYSDYKDECAVCYTCDGYGFCEGQLEGTDYSDDCEKTCWDSNVYANGFCTDGSVCHQDFVNEGEVCVGGESVPPSVSYNCGIWSDCVVEETEADEYYVGYADEGGEGCSDLNWISAGTTQTASEGYWWLTTEQVDTCSEEAMPESNPSSGGSLGVTTNVLAAPQKTTPTTPTTASTSYGALPLVVFAGITLLLIKGKMFKKRRK